MHQDISGDPLRANACGPPNHKESALLMATENTKGDGDAISLSIPAGNEAFLRRIISATQDGLHDELERFGDQLHEPRSKMLLEDAAYAALLEGLDCGRVVPDSEILATLARLAESIDRDNEYGRVVFEHRAIHDLLGQLAGMAPQ